MTRFPVAALAATLAFSFASPAFAANHLTLLDAFARAQAADPSIGAAEARGAAAEANIRQADVAPNPSLALDMENFGGSGQTRGFAETETTLAYEQPIERGGKRDARIALAERQRDVALIRGTIARLDLLEAVQRAYMDAVAAEAEVAVAVERLDVALRLDKEIRRRVAAARDPELASARAKAQVVEAELALEQSKLVAGAARARLRSYWHGTDEPRLDPTAIEDLRIDGAEPRPDEAADIRLREMERLAAAANVDVEKSKAYQDPTFSLGIRHFGRDDDVAFMVGGSIPLSINDDNSGAIDRAASEQRAADLDLMTYRQLRDREVQRLRAQLAIAAAEARQIGEAVIPAAQRALKLVTDGYARGAFSYLDVIGAQQGLSEARARRIAALKTFHANKASLDRLLGTFLDRTTMETPR